MNVNIRSCAILLLTALGFFLFIAPAALAAGEQPLATVNGDPVTGQDLLAQFNSRHSGHSRFLGGDAEARKFLDVVVEDRLLIQEAYSLGLADDAEVVKYVDEFERGKLAEWFVAQEITGKVAVTPADIETVWKTSLGAVVHARQFVVPTRAEAEEVRQVLLRGVDSEALARSCSTADSRLRGGNVMVAWGTFEPEWERVVFATEPGDVTPVIETANGFEVVLVVNHVEVDPPELESLTKQIDNTLYTRRLDARKKEISDQLWAKYHVELKCAGYSPALLAKLREVAPGFVIATWNGGELTLREAFEPDELQVLTTFEPLNAKKEIDERIRQTVNAPLVVLEARERKMNEVPAVVTDVDRYREYVMESVLFRDHVFRGLELTTADVEAYYKAHPGEFEIPEQRHVAQILVSSEADGKQLREKVAGGADFAEVAKKSSRDMVSAVNGGELGWISAHDVPPGFHEVLSLKPGQVSKPMKSDAGWHLIKVLETKPASIPPLEEVRKKVEERALDTKKREARAFWVEKLRTAGKIEIDPAAIAAFVKANEFTGKPPAQHAVE